MTTGTIPPQRKNEKNSTDRHTGDKTQDRAFARRVRRTRKTPQVRSTRTGGDRTRAESTQTYPRKKEPQEKKKLRVSKTKKKVEANLGELSWRTTLKIGKTRGYPTSLPSKNKKTRERPAPPNQTLTHHPPKNHLTTPKNPTR